MHFRPLHTSILDINNVFEPLVCCLKGIWMHPYTVTPAKLAPDFGGFRSLMECKNGAITSVFEADIHLRLIPTSLLDMYKVFEPLVCCLKGIWMHPYTITPARLAPVVTCGVIMMS